MRRKLYLFLPFLLMAYTMDSNAKNAKNTRAPLIDRALFFDNPEIVGGQLSPDGQWISFLKSYKGILNIWIKKVSDPFEKARPLTDSKRPLSGYFWSRDGKYLLYVKDENGDENLNIFVLNPFEGTDRQLPLSKNLTPLKNVTAGIAKVSKKNPAILYVLLNDRDKAWHDLYELDIHSGKRTLLYENKDRVTDYDFDWDERLRVLSKTDEKGTTVWYHLEPDQSLKPIYETSVKEEAYIAGWNPDNSACYLVSNKGDLDKSTLFLLNPETEALTKIESDPEDRVDFGGLFLDRNTHKVIATSYVLDKTKYYWKDKKWEEMYLFLRKRFPGREVYFSSSTEYYDKFLVSVSGDKYIADVYLYTPKDNALVYQYTPRPALKKYESYLTPMQPVSYKSSDGLDIPAYLSLPLGASQKLPAVVLVHGGPKGPRDTWGYDGLVQFLTNRGYAVLQPNYRASGGYGKKFLNAGDLQWGKLMQDDITWGVKYLTEKGIADKNKVAIMGGSYGGYATLAGLAFTPDVYACGVDIVGPSNIFTLLSSVPPYWEAGRAFLYAMVGDPDTEAGKKRIKDASPLFRADKIKKPLLIVQGANDPRVKQAEADQIVIALRDKGKKVTYLLADDEGHGFRKPVNQMAMYAGVEKFLAQTIGVQYQKTMPEAVAKRLKELEVDISKVTYTPAGKTTDSLPPMQYPFQENTYNYKVNLLVQGQNLQMTMQRQVLRDEEGRWVVTDKMQGDMGTMSDEVAYDEHYHPLGRTLTQMGQKITLDFKQTTLDFKQTNQVLLNALGKQKTFDFNGAFFASEMSGFDLFLGGMNLKERKDFVFELPDISAAQPKKMALTYFNKEEVKGVLCDKIEIKNTESGKDKALYWIHPETRMAEKIQIYMPHMGDAVMTIIKE